MRHLLIIFGGIAWTAAIAWAQGSDSSNFACVKELEMPAYPGIAQATGTEGDVSAVIVLAKDGKVVSVKTSGPDDSPVGHLMALTIENHVPFAKYDPACGGKTITLVFRFQIADVSGPPTAGFAFPNVFVIGAKQEPMQKQ